jgi:hypothetical protein
MLLIAYKDAQQNIRNCIFVPCISFQITFFFKNDKENDEKQNSTTDAMTPLFH